MGAPPAWELTEPGTAEAADPMRYPGYGVHWTNPRKPWETLEDGCPGGWYRCEFIDSFRRYRRNVTEGGGHDSNPILDRCEHWLVLEAVAYFEQCESAARAEYQTRLDALLRR